MNVSVSNLVELCQQEQDFYQKEPSLIVKRKDSLCLLRCRPDDDIYHKEFTDELLSCRGIVINIDSKKLVCFPWKNKLNYELFKKKFDFTKISSATSLVDGTTINLFYDDSFSEKNHPPGFEYWHLSTSTCLDAKNSRWSTPKSFHTMFWEIVPDLQCDKLQKNVCYSFVIQHIENKIVVPVLENRLILTLARDLDTQMDVTSQVVLEHLSKYITKVQKLSLSDLGITNYQEFEKYCCSVDEPMGVMLHATDGSRARYRNPLYTEILELRGSNPNKWTNYLYLFNQELDEEYLKHYPEDEQSMNDCWNAMVNCLKYIHQLYQSIYVAKEYQPVPFYLKRFINQIHKLYLQRKKNMDHPGITHKVVKGLFHQLSYMDQTKIIRNYQL